MNKKYIILTLSFLCLLLSSCLEIIDDLKINADGSGRLKTVLNLSKSKDQILTIWEKDSIMGRPVPSKLRIEKELAQIKNNLKEVEGISNSDFSCDWDRMIITYTIDFESIEALNAGVDTLSAHYTPASNKRPYSIIFDHNESGITKKVHPDIFKKLSLQVEKIGMGLGSMSHMVTVIRTEELIAGTNDPIATISKSKTSTFARSTLEDYLESSVSSNLEITFDNAR